MKNGISTGRILRRARRVMNEEMAAVGVIRGRLDESFVQAVRALRRCRGKVVVSGMGKSGLIARKIAATFSSTGCPAFFLNPAEGLHGDLGSLDKQDVLVLISNSGETEELTRILPRAKELGVRVISLLGAKSSTIAKASDVVIDCWVPSEAGKLGLAPSASTTGCLMVGDALAIVLSEIKGLTSRQFARLHPAGNLGERLKEKVGKACRRGKALPSVKPAAGVKEISRVIGRKGVGAALVMGEGRALQGIIVDGDLRRALGRGGAAKLSASDLMSRSPVTIAETESLSTALQVMEDREIYQLVVVDARRKVVGLVHIHDLLGRGKVKIE